MRLYDRSFQLKESLVGKATGSRAWPSAVIAIFVLSSGYAGANSLDGLIDSVVRKGPSGLLPAHLSVVLGVTRLEQPTPVKQAVWRDGTTVRTFNVCAAKHDDVVFIAYNEQSRSSKVYLVSPAGVLRKAVAYQPQMPATARSLSEAARDFAGELKFWTDFAHHLAGPNEPMSDRRAENKVLYP